MLVVLVDLDDEAIGYALDPAFWATLSDAEQEAAIRAARGAVAAQSGDGDSA